MKRQIVDLLSEIPGSGVIQTTEGRYILNYISVENKDEVNCYVKHQKDVTHIRTEVEDHWQDITDDISNTEFSRNAIGIEHHYPPFANIEEAKCMIFVSILQGILVYDVEPTTPVRIGVKHGDNDIIVFGFCDY